MLIPSTVKQFNAFSDLIVDQGFLTPVPKDLASLRIPAIQLLIQTLTNKNITPTGPWAVQYNEIVGTVMFARLESMYNSLISWTNRYFQTPVLEAGPPTIYAQQLIMSLIGTARGVDDLLNTYGTVPNFNAPTIQFIPPISGPSGNKFNATWFEDLVGSVYGTLLPTYADILTNQSSIQLLPEYATFINSITRVGGVIDSINALASATNVATANAIANVVLAPFQIVNVGGTKTGGSATGLANNATVYTATIVIGGIAHSISTVGSAAQTYTQLLAIINTKLGSAGTATIEAGNIKVASTPPATPVGPFQGQLGMTFALIPIGPFPNEPFALITPPPSVAIEDGITNPLFGSLTGFVSITATDADVPDYGTSYTALNAQAATQVKNLNNDIATINNQIAREQWWWYPLTGDPFFSRYSRVAQITTAAGIGLSLNGLKNSPLMSHSIDRVGSPNVILAKDEVL